jgi:ATP-dependent RNA helicase DeaD
MLGLEGFHFLAAGELALLDLEIMVARGYDTLTEVQDAVSTPEAAGRDLLVSAQTGSGKTVAYGLAMAGDPAGRGRALPALEPLALVIAPTRELALQVSTELIWLYGPAGGRVLTCVGGMDPCASARAGRRLRTSWSAPRAACATTWSAARSTCPRCGRRARRGRRDARHGLPRGPGGDPRRHAEPPHPAVLRHHAAADRGAGRRYQRDALRIDTVGRARARRHRLSGGARRARPRSSMRWSTCCASTRRAPSCSAPPARRCGACTAACSERGFSAVALSGELSQSRAQPCAAGAARQARAGLRRHRRRRPRHRPADRQPRHPRRAAARRRGAAAPLGPHGPRRAQGHRVLIVPYMRRRRVEAMLRTARIPVEWTAVPTAEDIRAWRLRRRGLVQDQRRAAPGRRPQVAAAADLPDRARPPQRDRRDQGRGDRQLLRGQPARAADLHQGACARIRRRWRRTASWSSRAPARTSITPPVAAPRRRAASGLAPQALTVRRGPAPFELRLGHR